VGPTGWLENHGRSEQEMDDILGYPHDFGNLKIGWISKGLPTRMGEKL